MRKKIAVLLFFCLLAMLFSGRVRAQITSTVMYGQVTDATGATVPGAQVSVTNTETNLTRTAQTNAEGEYRIELLPVGSYKVEITAPGFKRVVRSGVVLEVNVPARVDSVLQLGNLTDTVAVTESIPLINSSSAASSLATRRDNSRFPSASMTTQ